MTTIYAQCPSHTGIHILQDLAFFSDASYADDSLTRRSSHGLVVSFLGGTVDWKAAKQTTVTKSTGAFGSWFPVAHFLLESQKAVAIQTGVAF